jgi:EAL domain-containing protein (putative c-di-GMP-specific phosphodiesterase class I)
MTSNKSKKDDRSNENKTVTFISAKKIVQYVQGYFTKNPLLEKNLDEWFTKDLSICL